MIYLGDKAVAALRIAEAAEDPDEVVRRQHYAFKLFKEKPITRKLEELCARGYVIPDREHFCSYVLTPKGRKALEEHIGDPTEKPLVIDLPTLQKIGQHAGEVYPEECCGFLVEADYGRTWQVHECLNVQSELHLKWPDMFPKTGEKAYALGVQDAQKLAGFVRGGARVVLYHSHVENPPVFSKDDSAKAQSKGQPIFPGVDYLVMGISREPDPEDGRPVNYAAAYRWNAAVHEYLPVKVEILTPSEGVPDRDVDNGETHP